MRKILLFYYCPLILLLLSSQKGFTNPLKGDKLLNECSGSLTDLQGYANNETVRIHGVVLKANVQSNNSFFTHLAEHATAQVPQADREIMKNEMKEDHITAGNVRYVFTQRLAALEKVEGKPILTNGIYEDGSLFNVDRDGRKEEYIAYFYLDQLNPRLSHTRIDLLSWGEGGCGNYAKVKEVPKEIIYKTDSVPYPVHDTVEVPYAVHDTVEKPYPVDQPYPVDRPYPVPVAQPVSYPMSQPIVMGGGGGCCGGDNININAPEYTYVYTNSEGSVVTVTTTTTVQPHDGPGWPGDTLAGGDGPGGLNDTLVDDDDPGDPSDTLHRPAGGGNRNDVAQNRSKNSERSSEKAKASNPRGTQSAARVEKDKVITPRNIVAATTPKVTTVTGGVKPSSLSPRETKIPPKTEPAISPTGTIRDIRDTHLPTAGQLLASTTGGIKPSGNDVRVNPLTLENPQAVNLEAVPKTKGRTNPPIYPEGNQPKHKNQPRLLQTEANRNTVTPKVERSAEQSRDVDQRPAVNEQPRPQQKRNDVRPQEQQQRQEVQRRQQLRPQQRTQNVQRHRNETLRRDARPRELQAQRGLSQRPAQMQRQQPQQMTQQRQPSQQRATR